MGVQSNHSSTAQFSFERNLFKKLYHRYNVKKLTRTTILILLQIKGLIQNLIYINEIKLNKHQRPGKKLEVENF